MSIKRADSLKTRFVQEQQLLDHASERLWFGWGRFGRNRLFKGWQGRDSSTTDGYWIITLGTFGLVGFAALFGLLALTVFRARAALRIAQTKQDGQLVAALALIVAINMFDLLPNSSISPWTWLLAGALLGRAEAIYATALQFKDEGVSKIHSTGSRLSAAYSKKLAANSHNAPEKHDSMKLEGLRIRLFAFFKRPFSELARIKANAFLCCPDEPNRRNSILDLGGQPMIWESVPTRLDLVILNKPGTAAKVFLSHHKIRYVDGDACAVVGFNDNSFDIVFSNSVIEHVGAVDKQIEFAREVRRLGNSYWVQTPSKWFPVEAHCGMLFWWFYPQRLRHYFIERWRKTLPAWTQMVEETTVLTRADMRKLFPEATILTETSFSFPKSYVAYFIGS